MTEKAYDELAKWYKEHGIQGDEVPLDDDEDDGWNYGEYSETDRSNYERDNSADDDYLRSLQLKDPDVWTAAWNEGYQMGLFHNSLSARWNRFMWRVEILIPYKVRNAVWRFRKRYQRDFDGIPF